jgi:hypothetical protein
METYMDMARQALFEVDDVRASLEFDMEGMGGMEGMTDMIGQLETELRTLLKNLENGSHDFGSGDLPFMAMVRKQSIQVLPFKRLLEDINRVHLGEF